MKNGKKVLKFLETGFFLLFVLLMVSCSMISRERQIIVHLAEKSPWELASGQEFWYLLRWTDSLTGIREQHVAAGTSKVVIEATKGGLLVFAAYPNGTGTPVGGLLNPVNPEGGSSQPEVHLTYAEGAAADILLSVEEYAAGASANIDGTVFSRLLVEAGSGNGWRVRREPIYRDILLGHLDAAAFELLPEYKLEMYGIPQGYWIPDTPEREGISIHTGSSVRISGFFKGTFRYLLPSENLCLLVIGGESEAFWYIEQLPP
ncbi:MAG: hypothetical protein K9L21_02505 [Spirochaetia bacterium]|nr:hypothetical protein [Spirochaetia bacterium]